MHPYHSTFHRRDAKDPQYSNARGWKDFDMDVFHQQIGTNCGWQVSPKILARLEDRHNTSRKWVDIVLERPTRPFCWSKPIPTRTKDSQTRRVKTNTTTVATTAKENVDDTKVCYDDDDDDAWQWNFFVTKEEGKQTWWLRWHDPKFLDQWDAFPWKGEIFAIRTYNNGKFEEQNALS